MKKLLLIFLMLAGSFSVFSQDAGNKKPTIWDKVKTDRQKKIDEANKKNEQNKTNQKKDGIWGKIDKSRDKKIEEKSTKNDNEDKNKDDDDDENYRKFKHKKNNGKAWGRDHRWKHGKHLGDKNANKHWGNHKGKGKDD